jgi:hypothetical protein
MNISKDLLRGPQQESKNLFSDFIKKYEVIFLLIHSSFIDLEIQERKDNPGITCRVLHN